VAVMLNAIGRGYFGIEHGNKSSEGAAPSQDDLDKDVQFLSQYT